MKRLVIGTVAVCVIVVAVVYARTGTHMTGSAVALASTPNGGGPAAASTLPGSTQTGRFSPPRAPSDSTPTASGANPTSLAPAQSADPSADSVSWFSVQLAAPCVMPGGTQTMTVQSRPGYSVSFNSVYSDGKKGNAYGGTAVVPTNSAGWVQVKWTVAAAAPTGPVTVGIGTANGGSPATTTRTYTLAARC